MMQGGSLNEKDQGRRSDEDDEDLLEVLQVLQELDGGKDKEAIKAEKRLHLAHNLPSSNSNELGGSIPQAEFRNFMRLMLLYRFPFGLTEPSLSEIDAAADAIMESFTSGNDGAKGEEITWPAFDGALRETMPYLPRGLHHLFTNLIQHSSYTQKPHLSTAERWGFPAPPPYKEPSYQWGPTKCPRDPELPPIPYNPELSFGAMAQLAMCIPSTIDVRYHIQQLPLYWLRPTKRGVRNSLVYMSGSRTPTPDSNDTSNVVICLFIGRRLKDETFDRESQTLIIQLVPIYRVFGPGEGGRTMFDVEMHNDVTSLLDSARGGFSLWREHSHSATFRIDGRKGTLKVNRPYEGPLPWREDLEETLVKEEITLDKIKLFCFAP